jgi:hypothetical protein
MLPGQDSGAKGMGAAIVALVFTVLAIASTILTTYLSGLWAYAMMWLLPLFVGGVVTMMLVVVAVIGAVFAIGETRTRRFGIAAVALIVVGLAGGAYGGCRKGFHDVHCGSSCVDFW